MCGYGGCRPKRFGIGLRYGRQTLESKLKIFQKSPFFRSFDLWSEFKGRSWEIKICPPPILILYSHINFERIRFGQWRYLSAPYFRPFEKKVGENRPKLLLSAFVSVPPQKEINFLFGKLDPNYGRIAQ